MTGLSNWILTILRSESGVSILRAKTCDEEAVLPDELFGLPVTAIADRALAPDAAPLSGEELTVVCGRAEGEFDNRNIKELTLPRELKSVGQYAFMNCREIHTLRLHDGISEFATSALMNCRSFSKMELSRVGEKQGGVLASIVLWIPKELDVTVHEYDGDIMRLIFPEYTEVLVENEPTHFFNYIIESAGYPYHNVFRDKSFSVQDFDGLWSKCLSMEHDEDAAMRLAWWRLRYPEGLSGSARTAYTNYLTVHIREAMVFALDTRDITGLEILLSECAPDTETLRYAQECARSLRFTEAVAVLLEKQHQSSARGRSRSFAL